MRFHLYPTPAQAVLDKPIHKYSTATLDSRTRHRAWYIPVNIFSWLRNFHRLNTIHKRGFKHFSCCTSFFDTKIELRFRNNFKRKISSGAFFIKENAHKFWNRQWLLWNKFKFEQNRTFCWNAWIVYWIMVSNQWNGQKIINYLPQILKDKFEVFFNYRFIWLNVIVPYNCSLFKGFKFYHRLCCD